MSNIAKTCFLSLLIFFSACEKDEEKKEEGVQSIEAQPINNLIKEVIEEINNNYADSITKEKLEKGAINGMLAVLDEHSVYINQEEFEAFNQTTRGTYLGIGIEIKHSKEGAEVVSVIEDSPAFDAGLKAADVITHIDKKEVKKMQAKELYSRLSSDTALKIVLSILRNKTETFDISLKKSVIQMQTVKTEFIDDIAVVKINYFNENTVTSMNSALKDVKKHKAKGIILDLRNNPGGILDQAIEVADMFLDANKVIIEFRSKNTEESKTVFSKKGNLAKGLPMIILIDKNTASGAELVASALGENKRAIILGLRSYGKGSLQTVIPIPGKGAIKLTTAFLYTASGSKLNNNGIMPDILVEQSEAETLIQRAIDLLHGIFALGNGKEQQAALMSLTNY
ncbi:MAG: S41 family peptidase [Holosporales bacterium]|jgi:carboxyl-terminal processing protease|nr:S41 family peptidase [Holosporales bacterium]